MNFFTKYIILTLIIFISYQKLFSDNLITIISNSDTLFVGEEITILNNDNSSIKSVYYSLDSGNVWNLITNDLQTEFTWKLPFSLKRNIQFKAIQQILFPPKIIWDNYSAHIGEVRSIDISDDGKYIVSLGRDNYIRVWDIGLRKCIDSIELGATSYCYSAKFFHSNDKILYSNNDNGFLWDRLKNSNGVFYTIGDFIRSIDIHPSLNKFAMVTNDNNLAVFNESFILPIPIFLRLYATSDYSNFYSVRYSQKGEKIGIATFTGKIIISEGQLGKQDSVYLADNNLIFSLDFIDNDSKVAFGGASSQLKILDLNNKSVFPVEPKFLSQIRDIKYNFPRNDIIAVSLDSTLKQWNASSLQQISIGNIKEPFGILSVDITSTGDTFVTCGRNNTFRVWQNYSKLIDSQLINFEYRQKVAVSVFSKKNVYLPSEKIDINLNVYSMFSDTLQKIGNWILNSEISIPMNIIYLQNEERYPKIDNHIIIDTSQSIDFSEELLYRLTGKILYANSIPEVICIKSVNIIPEDNFYILIKNLEINHNYICGKELNPNIIIQNDAIIESVEINKNRTIIKVKILSEDNYKLYISNYLGEIIKIINTGRLKLGNYEFCDNNQELDNGFYFFVLENSNHCTSKKIIIKEY